MAFLIYLYHLIIEGDDISMRKDITIEKLIIGGEKMNKSELSRQYGCCWRTIDRRLNPDKYKKEKVIRIYKSKLDPYKNIIDEKVDMINNKISPIVDKEIEEYLATKVHTAINKTML